MKLKLFKSLIFTLIFILSFSVLAFAASTGKQITKEVDGIKATLTFNNEKIKTGDNEFTIELLDKNGQPLTDSNLEVTADMDRTNNMSGDGMGNSKPMMIDLKEGSTKGQYSGMVNLSAKGKWIIKTTFDVQGQKKNIDLDFNAESQGPNWLIIIGFSGVIILILVIAAINKKKSAKA